MSSQASKPSLWTSLLFLHGYVADAHLAQRLAGAAEAADATPIGYGAAMCRFVTRGRKLSLRLCQGIGSGLVHMQ